MNEDEPIKSKYITNEEQVISTKYTEEIKVSIMDDNKEDESVIPVIVEVIKEEEILKVIEEEIIVGKDMKEIIEETKVVENNNKYNIIEKEEEKMSTIEDKVITSINIDEIIIEEKSIINNNNNNNNNNNEKPISPKVIFDEDRPIKSAANAYSEDQPIKANNSQSFSSKWTEDNEFPKEKDSNIVDKIIIPVKKAVKVTTTTAMKKKDIRIVEDKSMEITKISTDEDRPIKAAANAYSEDQPIKANNSQLTNSKWTEHPEDNNTLNNEIKPVDKSTPKKILTKIIKSTTPKKSISSNTLEEQTLEDVPIVEGEPDTRPLNIRLGDKNWKVRMTAFEELKNSILVSNDKTRFEEYASWLPKMVSDSNPGALDSGLDAGLVFIDNVSIECIRQYSDKIYSSILDKSFNSTRILTQTKGKAVLMKLIEVDEPTSCVSFLLSKLGDKKPKVPPTCLDVIREGIIAFGAKSFPVKDMIKEFEKVLNGSNAGAREAVFSLMLELTKWIGIAPFNILLNAIRSAQKTEFERLLSERGNEGKPIPKVWLRKERPEQSKLDEMIKSATDLTASNTGDDAREYLEEIDINKKLKATEYSTLIASTKWAEQLQALQLIIDILGTTPKIKAGSDVHEIVSVIKGFLRQGHLNLQTTSLKIIVLFAYGLRAEFNNTIRPIIQSIIQKSKEKRLVPDVSASLINILQYCCNFDSFNEDIIELLKNKKSPTHSRVCILEFITNSINTMPDRISNGNLKSITEACISCTDDSDPLARDCCVVSLSALYLLIKKRGKPALEVLKLLNSLEQTNSRVFKKINEIKSTSTISKESVKDTTVKKSIASVSSSAAPKTTSLSKKSVPVVTTSKKSIPAATSKKSNKETEDETVEDLVMTPEDAEALLAGLGIDGWDSNVQTLMNSAKWQEKVEALTLIGEKIAETKTGGQYSSALVCYIGSKTSNYKISNISILKAVIQTACLAATNSGNVPFNKSAAWELIKHLGDKLSDKKIKDLIISLLTALSETINPTFVLKRMKFVMEKCKAPLGHQYFLEWLKTSINDFGSSNFPVQFVSTLCQNELENKVGDVRTASVEVMGALYNQIGPKLQVSISDDMKPALKVLLEAEFTKVGYDPAASKKSKIVKEGEVEISEEGGIPRCDITSILDKNIITELNFTDSKTSWQNRKIALESIISSCENSGYFIEANKGTSEILKAVKNRINDTQANLKPIAVTAIGKIIASLAPESGCKYLRVVSSDLIGGLADNKNAMRNATIAAMQMAVTLNATPGEGADAPVANVSLLNILLAPLGEALTTTPIGRMEILTWLLLHVDSIQIDCSDLTTPLVVAMQDKTAIVRGLAEQFLGNLVSKELISRDQLDKATRNLAPAALRTLQAPIEKMIQSFNAKPLTTDLSNLAIESEVATEETPPLLSNNSKSSVQNKKIQKEILPPAASTIEDPGSPGGNTEKWHLKKTNKGKRLDDFYKINWPQPPEEPGENELQALKIVWEPLISNELSAILFPTSKASFLNQDSVIDTVNELTIQLEGPYALNHTDLLLRWCIYALCLRETSAGLIKILTLIHNIYLLMQKEGVVMHDSEMNIVLPQLLDKCGHKSERHKICYKLAISTAGEILAPNKLNQVLLAGLTSKNKKSRVVCLEEILRVVESAGNGSLGRSGVKEIANYLDSKDNDVSGRNACLELCYVLYISLNSDKSKLMKLLGDVSERSASMIEDRFKQKNKLNSTVSAVSAAAKSTLSAINNNSATPERNPKKNVKISPKQVKQSPSESEESYEASPFRLDITPPDADTRSPLIKSIISPLPTAKVLFKQDKNDYTTSSPELTLNYEPTPAVNRRNNPSKLSNSNSKVNKNDNDEDETVWKDKATPTRMSLNGINVVTSPIPSTSIKNAEEELEGIYSDIALKIDRLIEFDDNDNDNKYIHDEAKDYIKILHSILIGEWSTEQQLPEDCLALQNHSQALAARLSHCISRSFKHPKGCISDDHNSPNIDIDVSLVSVSLATLFAMVKRSDISTKFTQKSLFIVFYEVLRHIVDERLTAPSNQLEDAIKAIQEISRALNMIVIKLASEAKTGLVLASLIEVLYLCIATPEGASHLLATFVEDGSMLPEVMKVSCTKPTSQLLLRVLTDEMRSPNPFNNENIDNKALLQSIHHFFLNYPPNAADDVPFSSVKTILIEMIKSLGADEVLKIIQSLNISSNHFVVKLACRIGNLPLPENDEGIKSKILIIIDEITSARDKLIPIRKLHLLKLQNPNLDINSYLQRLSTAFRRFVIDSLLKLETSDVDENILPEVEIESIVKSSSFANNIEKTNGSTTSSDAMKTLEQIKNRKNDATIITKPSSPKARANNLSKIRGSLSNLTASLDISKNILDNTGDNDLANRLSKLKESKKINNLI